MQVNRLDVTMYPEQGAQWKLARNDRYRRWSLLLTCALLSIGGVSFADPPASTTYTYDDAGRLKTTTSSTGAAAGYEYDAAGNRTGVNLTAAGSPGLLQFSQGTYAVAENVAGGVLQMNVVRSGGTSGVATVLCSATSGTATAGSDFANPGVTLTWPNGVTGAQVCNVPITNDTTYEGNETFNAVLSGATGASLGTTSSAVVTINEDDPQPPSGELRFTATSASVAENVSGGTITVLVERVNGTFGAATVLCSAAAGTATAGTDFTNPGATLNWASGSGGTRNCVVPISNDSTFEPDETFTGNLSAATGAAIVTPSQITVTITNDDPQPPAGTLQFTSSTASVTEGTASTTLSVSRINGSFGAASVTCATTNGTALSGSDYTAVNETLLWNAGDTTNKSCVVPILNDSTYELAENFSATLSNVSGATVGTTPTVTVTVNDDDPQPPSGTLQFTANDYPVAENVAGGAASVTVSRVGGTFGSATVQCSTSNGSAIAGSDYTATSTTLTWGNGVGGNQVCSIPILNETIYELDETVNVTLSSFSGATQGSPVTATVTITNDDPEPIPGTISLTATTLTVLENVGTASFGVSRTGGSNAPVTVIASTVAGGTATAGSDYTTTSTTLSWAANENDVKYLNIPVTDDIFPEASETVSIALSSPTGGAALGTTAATLTINDNETGLVRTLPSTITVAESGGSVTVNVERFDGGYGPASAVVQTVNGTAIGGSDFTVLSTTLNWAAGEQSTKQVVVPITDDSVSETDEGFVVGFGTVTGATVWAFQGQTSVTITDNDSSLPGTPTNLVSNDPPPVTDGAYVLSWTAAGTGGPVSYYELQEDNQFGDFSTYTSYTINAPSVSRSFTSVNPGSYAYRVRACNASNQCSVFSNVLSVEVQD